MVKTGQEPKPVKSDDDRKPANDRQKLLALREAVFDELNIVCSIVGRKEDLDRVDITHLLKANQEVSYLACSDDLKVFIDTC